MAKNPNPPSEPHDWRRDDPYIVVSRRAYVFGVPTRHLGIDRPSAAAVDGRAAREPMSRIRLEIGPTFLSADVSAWAFARRDLNSEAPSKMPEGERGPVMMTNSEQAAFMGGAYRKEGTDKPDHAKIEAAMLSAFRALGWGKNGRPSNIDEQRFQVEPGDTLPEVMICRVSEIFGEGSKGYDAMRMLEDAIGYCKHRTHLGALHDFAVMQGRYGRSIADKCRARGRVFGITGR